MPFYKAVMNLKLPFYHAVMLPNRTLVDLVSPLYKAMSELMVFYRVVLDLVLPYYKAVVDLSKDWLWLSIMSGSGFGEILFEISPSSCKKKG